MRVDEKLAFGLAMAEARPILRAPRSALQGSIRAETHPVRASFKPVAWRYQTNRIPDASYVEALVRSVDAMHEGDPRTVWRETETYEPEHGVVGISRRYLSMRPMSGRHHGSIAATCTSLGFDAYMASLSQTNLFEVDLHAVRRFHMRTRSGLVRDALAAMGSMALRDFGLAANVLRVSATIPGHPLALPFADGLLLGHGCTEADPEKASFTLVQPLGQPKAVMDANPTAEFPSFRIATFIGPSEMFPNQTRLRKALLDIASRYAGCIRQRSYLETSLLHWVREMAEESTYAAMFRHEKDMRRELNDLLSEADMASAMGRGRGLPVMVREAA